MSDYIDVLHYVTQTQNISLKELRKAVRILTTPFDELRFLKKLDLEKYQEKYNMSYDLLNGTYKELDEDAYERLRKESFKDEDKPLEKIAENTIKTANMLDEAANYMEYNRFCHKAGLAALTAEVCKHMIFAGATLTDILKYVPRTHAADIYHFSERCLGVVMNLTDEERRLVEEDEAKHSETKKKEGGQKISLADLLKYRLTTGVPHIKDDKWELECSDTTIVGTPSEIAQHFVDARMNYLYKDRFGNLKFKPGFEAVLEVLMQDPDDFSVEGCEESYSRMELDLIQRVQKKMVGMAEEKIARRDEEN